MMVSISRRGAFLRWGSLGHARFSWLRHSPLTTAAQATRRNVKHYRVAGCKLEALHHGPTWPERHGNELFFASARKRTTQVLSLLEKQPLIARSWSTRFTFSRCRRPFSMATIFQCLRLSLSHCRRRAATPLSHARGLGYLRREIGSHEQGCRSTRIICCEKQVKHQKPGKITHDKCDSPHRQ